MSPYTKNLNYHNERRLEYLEYQRPRGYEILCLAARGLSNREIGEELCISPCTVKNIFWDMYKSFGAKNRAHMVAKAIMAGIIPFTRDDYESTN